MVVGDADVGNIPAQRGALVIGAVLENRLDIGCVAADLRDHYENILAAQILVAIEQGQQVVVQHLAFAHRAVAQVYRDRVVDRRIA